MKKFFVLFKMLGFDIFAPTFYYAIENNYNKIVAFFEKLC